MAVSKVVAIVQARMGSTRLPGKVLKPIGEMTMLAMVITRAGSAGSIDEVVVATTAEPEDDAVEAECDALEIPCVRGSRDDVLDRYVRTARAREAAVVVRVTADCPLIDPAVIDEVVSAFLEKRPDYASNTIERTWPLGLDTEVMTAQSLERAWREAEEPWMRVHVTPYIHQNPHLFRLLPVTGGGNHGSARWTVDTREDIEFVRALCSRLPSRQSFSWVDALAVLEREPSLAEMNRQVRQKSLAEG